MSIFHKLFPKEEAKAPIEPPPLRFGRYNDCYKTREQYEAWEKALTCFAQEAYLDSIEAFFTYLLDKGENNVSWQRVQDQEASESMQFQIFQGSRTITGKVGNGHLEACSAIASADNISLASMRLLLEKNFQLQYCRFAIREQNTLCMVFDSSLLDASPYKLYFALKELAIQADKQDDLLQEESAGLVLQGTQHLIHLTPENKEKKSEYLRSAIRTTIDTIERCPLEPDQYPGAVSYQLLALIYKLDYLVRPEGYTMEALERMDRLFFSKDNHPIAFKNKILLQGFNELLQRSSDDFAREFYKGIYTFGITHPVDFNRVTGFIRTELPNMAWYAENGHKEIALAVPSYIVGYSLFNYSLPLPVKDLFHIFMRVVEHPFFTMFGYPVLVDIEKEKPLRKVILRAMNRTREIHAKSYPHFEPNSKVIDFSNTLTFAQSYLFMVLDLDLSTLHGYDPVI